MFSAEELATYDRAFCHIVQRDRFIAEDLRAWWEERDLRHEQARSLISRMADDLAERVLLAAIVAYAADPLARPALADAIAGCRDTYRKVPTT